MRATSAIAWTGTCVALMAPPASAGVNLLVAQGAPNLGYHYGGSSWDNMTAAINGAVDTVTVAPNLSDLGSMLTHDALWVDQRWTTGSLTATEVNNISAFIATGRRVVLIGENNEWTAWNNQILGIVGGSYVSNSSINGVFAPAITHPLTTGVSDVRFVEDGVASGGTAVFAENVATLWGGQQNVLTLLSVNVLSDDEWNQWDNAIFANNLANWVGAQIPTPGCVLIFGVLMHRSRRRSMLA